MTTRKEIEAVTNSFVNLLVDYIRANLNRSFTCNVKMDWSLSRVCSRGGKYATGFGINMAMLPSVKLNASSKNPVLFREYISFKNDPVIGEFWSDTWQLNLQADVAHEVAHVWCAFEKDTMDHGSQWKSKYAILRKEFINPFINKKLNEKIRQPGTKEYKKITNTALLDKTIEKDKSHRLYLEKCVSVGLTPSHLNKWYTIGSREYKIVGWNGRARKNFLKIERDDGKIFVTNPMMIKMSSCRDITSLKAANRK